MTVDKAAAATIPETAGEVLDHVSNSVDSPPGQGQSSGQGAPRQVECLEPNGNKLVVHMAAGTVMGSWPIGHLEEHAVSEG